MAARRGRLLPSDYWPKLALIGCWKGGPLRLYLNSLSEYYGDVPVRELGLLASEGRMSIPISDHGSAGVLNIIAGFFEFLPASHERPRPDDATLLAHELEVGGEYWIIPTGLNGLYRYDIHDIVRVEGFAGSAPLISFVNKGKHIASITGEKLAEYQAVTAFQEALEAGDPPPFVVSPARDEVPYYTLLLEDAHARALGAWPARLAKMDGSLKRLNVEYACKRDSGRIGPIRLTVIRDGALAAICRPETQGDQFKAVYLRTEMDYHKCFPQVREIHSLANDARTICT
jgi:hypothetical protein